MDPDSTHRYRTCVQDMATPVAAEEATLTAEAEGAIRAEAAVIAVVVEAVDMVEVSGIRHYIKTLQTFS